MALDVVEPGLEIAADLAAIEGIPFAEDCRQITAQLADSQADRSGRMRTARTLSLTA